MRATAFGLDVRSETPLSLLAGAVAEPTGRELGLTLRRPGEEAPAWPADARLVCDEREPDGVPLFQIEAHPQAGYLICGPHYGSHRLSADGRALCCDPAGRPEAQWQRLLVAQVLPFAALLQGREVLHASAVIWRGRGVAFLGGSGAGKTSLALELCDAGAEFLADDVLALEVREQRLLAHPGTPVAADAQERLVQVPGAREPVALAALFFLDRRADGPAQPRFAPAADARALLGATFNFVLRTPERQRRLLEVCALAARARVERIEFGEGASAASLAAAVRARLDAPG
jgi:hypothetical protein